MLLLWSALQSGRPPPVIFGDSGAGLGDNGFAADNIWGKGYQASQSFTAKSIHTRNSSANVTDADFRLGVYNATDANTWGTLAGQSVPRGGAAIGELVSLPLLAPINIVSGQFYSQVVQPFVTSANLRTREATTGRFLSDPYFDGLASPATATSAGASLPLIWLSSEEVTLPTASDITYGPTGAGVSNTSLGGGFCYGMGYVCNTGGTINFLNILGSSAASSAVNFRLGLYEASSPFVWGTLVASTAVTNGLGISESKKVATTASAVLTPGRYYSLVVQPEGTLPVRLIATTLGRSMSGVFAGGMPSPANGTSDFGPQPLMWASTS